MTAGKIVPTLAAALAVYGLVACQGTPGRTAHPDAAVGPSAAMAAPAPPADAPVVEVEAEDYAFNLPETLPSGWVTLRFTNSGEENHFLMLHRLPEGKTYDEYVVEIGEPFNEVWYPLRDGEITQEEALERMGETIPEWFWAVQQMGGTGIVAPGGTTEVTVRLEPGDYVVECYMKTEEGEFHGMEGMVDPITVTEEASDEAPPEADLRLTATNAALALEGEATPGRHTVAVHIAERPEAGFGHNVHVARLPEGVAVDEVQAWLNWMNVEGLQGSAPATFVGGMNILPEGATGYFDLELEPGRYLFVSEYTGHQGVRTTVTVE